MTHKSAPYHIRMSPASRTKQPCIPSRDLLTRARFSAVIHAPGLTFAFVDHDSCGAGRDDDMWLVAAPPWGNCTGTANLVHSL